MKKGVHKMNKAKGFKLPKLPSVGSTEWHKLIKAYSLSKTELKLLIHLSNKQNALPYMTKKNIQRTVVTKTQYKNSHEIGAGRHYYDSRPMADKHSAMSAKLSYT